MTTQSFWEQIIPEPTTGCWLWSRGRVSAGYGHFKLKGESKLRYAHRYAWECTNGPIPPGLGVLHKCDIPACCNPDHLFVGTQKDNSLDMVRKGRCVIGARPYGVDQHMAKLNDDLVREIRASTESNRALARRMSVSHVSITNVRAGKTWKHVTAEA